MEKTNNSPTCIMCGSHNVKKLFPVKKYSIYKCSQCEVVQTHPIESEEVFDTLYDQNYFEDLTQRKRQEQSYHKRILRLIEQYKAPGKMLEVGIGIGLFM